MAASAFFASHLNHLEQQINELMQEKADMKGELKLEKQEKAELKSEIRHLQAVHADLNCQIREMQERHRGEIMKLYERERFHEASRNCYNSKVCFLMLTSNFK